MSFFTMLTSSFLCLRDARGPEGRMRNGSLLGRPHYIHNHCLLCEMSTGWELNSASTFGLTTCSRPQLKLYYYYCYYGLGLKPVCGAGRRKLWLNLAPMPKLTKTIFFHTFFDKTICVSLSYQKYDAETTHGYPKYTYWTVTAAMWVLHRVYFWNLGPAEKGDLIKQSC